MKLLTVEMFERFRSVNQPALELAGRVSESARRLQEFAAQILVIEKAMEEETATLAAREEDLRQAQEHRDAFLSEFSEGDRRRLVEGRRSTKREAPVPVPPSPLRESTGGRGARSIGDPLTVSRL